VHFTLNTLLIYPSIAIDMPTALQQPPSHGVGYNLPCRFFSIPQMAAASHFTPRGFTQPVTTED
jgi:hypothetical protein